MPPQAAAANLNLFYSFEQFISDQQKLAEFATWLHTKGVIVARIGYVVYDKEKASYKSCVLCRYIIAAASNAALNRTY